jgi:hypothetical protein
LVDAETRRLTNSDGPLCSSIRLDVVRPTGHKAWGVSDAVKTKNKSEAFGGGRMAKSTHGDPAVPEDHDVIKSEELAALEQEVDGLKTALGTRTIIGKAMGVIMERQGVNEEEAFEMLKTMSQHSNVKLRDVAAKLASEPQPSDSEEP